MAKKQTSRKSAATAKRAGGRASSSGRSRPRKAAPRKSSRAAGARRTAGRAGARGAAKRTGKRAAKRTPATKRTAARKRTTTSRARRQAPRGGQVSKSTTRTRWVESPDDRGDRPGQTLATRSHEVIQRWAEERGAQPATIPGGDQESPRVLRLDFPGFGGQNLEPVDWEEWFRTFDDRNLVFLFQERLKDGSQSNFFRLDNPEREDA